MKLTNPSMKILLVTCVASVLGCTPEPVDLEPDSGDVVGDPPDAASPGGKILISTGSVPLTSFDFGDVEVGTTSVILALTVTNDTPETTGVVSVTLGGADPGQYRLEPATDCDDGLVLAPGASCDVRLYFSPTALGTKDGDLEVTASPGGSASVILTGTGVVGPSLSVNPPFGDFAVIEFGHPTSQAFTVTNTGPDLSIAAVAVTPTFGSGFSVTSTTCVGALVNAATCNLTIRFDPSTFGQDSGDLVITTNLGSVAQGTNFVMGRGGGRVDVTLAGAGTGRVASDGGGNPNINCPTTCSGLYIDPTHVLSATADEGSVFVGWSDEGATCGTASTCEVVAGTMPRAITATFEIAP
jgi:hypothetical protein